jgi:DNA-binding phage protein
MRLKLSRFKRLNQKKMYTNKFKNDSLTPRATRVHILGVVARAKDTTEITKETGAINRHLHNDE